MFVGGWVNYLPLLVIIADVGGVCQMVIEDYILTIGMWGGGWGVGGDFGVGFKKCRKMVENEWFCAEIEKKLGENVGKLWEKLGEMMLIICRILLYYIAFLYIVCCYSGRGTNI